MAKIHILESDNDNSYKVAIHFPTTSGNNTVGQSWKACALASGTIGSTILEVGTNPGNTTQAEHDSIIAGDTVEIIMSIQPGLNPTDDAVEALCDQQIAMCEADTARVLKYYGYTIGA